MSEHKKERREGGKVKSKFKKDGIEKNKKTGKDQKHKTAAKTLALLADESVVNPTLSSLFAAQPIPPKPANSLPGKTVKRPDDVEISAAAIEPSVESSAARFASQQLPNSVSIISVAQSPDPGNERKRKWRRKHDDEEIEDVYMRRLAREEAKDADLAAAERASKRQEALKEPTQDNVDGEEGGEAVYVDDNERSEDAVSPPPRHETEQAVDVDLAKANRTVFLGNVSTAAISSKTARTELIHHLKSFFSSVLKPGDGEKHKVESIRFRSTPYATAMPKKAAYATKQLMDATTKSTNAYVVYSSQILAREAAKHLNGTIVLGRHLRVDEVAHPAKVDNRRCIFVGNLGYVDDESNIQAANEEEGKEKRKTAKQPADVEEGLWRTFGKCGTVESVRVIRDSTTRVGKGIAYVQFADENAVEAALLYNEKKFPPMLPRKLRVSRAKAQKRNPKPGSGRPMKSSTNGYQRKISGEEASQMGRAGKLFGRAAAARAKQSPKDRRDVQQLSSDMRKPEAFVFEGHRASSKSGKSGLKLGGRAKQRSGKPTSRSAKFKASKKTK